MRSVVGVLMIAGLSLIFGCKKDDDNGNSNVLSNADSTFVMMAAMGNYAEISAGHIASSRSQDSAVISFGQMMVKDHLIAGQKLDSVVQSAGANNLTVDSLDAMHKRLSDTLMMLSGNQFDSVYILSQVRDHQNTISLFQNEANNGQHQNLRQFATSLLPELQMHLEHADSLAAQYR